MITATSAIPKMMIHLIRRVLGAVLALKVNKLPAACAGSPDGLPGGLLPTPTKWGFQKCLIVSSKLCAKTISDVYPNADVFRTI